VKVKNLPNGMSAKEWTRYELDRLGIRADLTGIPWRTKKIKLSSEKADGLDFPFFRLYLGRIS